MIRAFCVMLLASTLAGAPLRADQVGVPRDSTAADSARRERTPRGPHGMMLPFAGLIGALAVAPPAIMFFKIPEEQIPTPFPWHWRAYASGGVVGETEGPNYWSHSEMVELRGGHLMAGFRHQRFLLDGPVAYQEAQVGWVFGPGMRVEGGVAGGFRDGSGRGARSGVVVSAPIRMTDKHGAFLFEPTYLFHDTGIDWEYRLQAEMLRMPPPFFVGVAVEARSLHRRGSSAGNIALLVGVQY